jgi:hypothetical protein
MAARHARLAPLLGARALSLLAAATGPRDAHSFYECGPGGYVSGAYGQRR